MGRKQRIFTAIKLAILLFVLLCLFLVMRHIGFREILAAMKRADRFSIVTAGFATLVAFIMWCFRWTRIMLPEERKSFIAVFPIYMSGAFGNMVTPGAKVGGEPLRAYYMSKVFGGERTAHLGTIIADKVAYATVFLSFVIISALFVVGFVPILLVYKLLLGGMLALLIGAIVSGVLLNEHIGERSRALGKILPTIYHMKLLKFIRQRFPTYHHFENYAISKVDNLVNPLLGMAERPKAIAQVVLISVVSWLLICLAYQVLFHSLGADLSYIKVLVIVTVSFFLGDVSMSPGGAGFMEAAMLALCAAFGVRSETAAAVTLIGRGIFYLLGMGLGGICFGSLAAIYGRKQKEQAAGDRL